MKRRQALRVLGSSAAAAALLPFAPSDAFAAGRAIHDRLQRGERVVDGLTDAQLALVAAVAGTIIPATDTPGAREARVHEWINVVYADWMSDSERSVFSAGLESLDEMSQREHGTTVAQLAEPDRLALLTSVDAMAFAPQPYGAPPPAFRRLKQLVIHGYYTSEIGQREELKVVIIPGRYDSCRQMQPAPGGGGSDR
ncbi:MAG TPA: gluconate 2-dehydrogenase subunit 3 family protein [Gemmatimonadaceae bacterium]|nr:gluconate 2-dehydrogenase subunit 3 family protein [Gemmatimonadaceae bacterium]